MNSASPELTTLAASGGVSIDHLDARDPFEVLDDLMTVVEALCPVWPPKDIDVGPGIFKL